MDRDGQNVAVEVGDEVLVEGAVGIQPGNALAGDRQGFRQFWHRASRIVAAGKIRGKRLPIGYAKLLQDTSRPAIERLLPGGRRHQGAGIGLLIQREQALEIPLVPIPEIRRQLFPSRNAEFLQDAGGPGIERGLAFRR